MLTPKKQETFFDHTPEEHETPRDETVFKPVPIKPKEMYSVKYVLNELVLKQIEVWNNIYLRVIKVGEEVFLDLNQFHGGKPTKKGLRFPIKYGKTIKNALDNI